jgi:hypothetical protein
MSAGGEDVPARADVRRRLWRARRRHHHIDAMLLDRAVSCWDLTFLHDDHALMTWTFTDRESAVAEADRRLAELIRAGWNVHW